MDGAIDLLGPADGDRVADVGFGGGYALGRLLDRVASSGHVVGVDPSRQAARVARRRYRRSIADGHLTVVEGDMRSLPSLVGAGTLTGAITVNTIYYISELAESLRGLRAALSADGGFVLGIGDPDFMATLPFANDLILRPVTVVLEQLAGSGFTVTDHIRTSEDPRAFHLLRCVARSASQQDRTDHQQDQTD
ncbi:MAG: methyltransferase domain-containing protein [Gordonia polyisoprenivorans]|nr:methyltransferase domain-containing protein [Gordonia polyisoprenivorans]